VPKDWPYYFMGGVEIPLKPLPRLAAVALDKRLTSASERTSLIALAEQSGLRNIVRDPDTGAQLDEVNGSVLYFEPQNHNALIFNFERNGEGRPVSPTLVTQLQHIFAAHNGRVACAAELGAGRVKLIDNRYLVKFPRHRTEDEAKAFASRIGAKVLRESDPNAGYWLIEFTDAQNAGRHLDVIARLVKSRAIASGEPNFLLQMQAHGCPADASQDPYKPCQDYLSRQQVQNAWCYMEEVFPGRRYGSSEIRVATIDMPMTFNTATSSSIDPDVDPTLYCYNVEDGVPCSDSSPPVDGRENHGMASYGIISAKPDNGFGITGIAPNALHIAVELISIIGSPDRYSQTLLWVGGRRPDPPVGTFNPSNPPPRMQPAHVISCSHGLDGSSPTPDIIKDAFRQLTCSGRGGLGTVIVYSAGNRDTPLETRDEFATDPHTIGVTNTDISNGREVRQFRDHSYASNYSPWISLCANGESALSLQSDPNADGPVCDGVDHGKGVFHHDGTSAAASMVSAAAVLVLSINQNLNWKQVRSILCASAEKIDCDNTDPNGKWQYCGPGPQQPLPAACISLPRGLQWFSEWYGFGRLNVYEAVKLAHATAPQTNSSCDG